MSDTDLDLLKRYARQHAEDAFAEIVRRHVDLVFSAALRQVRSRQLAEEVAQSVFSDLAQQADRLTPDAILSAWLYQVTRRTAIDVVRRESRRQLREQAAHELTAMNATDDHWMQIEPLLDEAMQALDDTDRAAVLLRYFENKSLRDVGQKLGTSEDAARKRIARAVERLREFLTRRGVAVGATGLVAVISANAVHAAPVGLAATISAAGILAGTTAAAAAATTTATKVITMITIQKTLVAATIVAAVGTGVYEAHQASDLRSQLLQAKQQVVLSSQQSQQAGDDASSRLAALQQENERLRQDAADAVKLRGEVERLQKQQQAPVQSQPDALTNTDPFIQSVQAMLVRASQLNGKLQEMPDKKIPELQYLTESDWLSVAKNANLNSDAGVRKALSELRADAKTKFGTLMGTALAEYLQANNGVLPGDPMQLQPYFKQPVDASVLERYQMLYSGSMSDVPPGPHDQEVIGEKAPVDNEYDSHLYVGPGHTSIYDTGLHHDGDPDPTWTNRH